jgi:hypothetical protein
MVRKQKLVSSLERNSIIVDKASDCRINIGMLAWLDEHDVKYVQKMTNVEPYDEIINQYKRQYKTGKISVVVVRRDPWLSSLSS